MNTPFDFDSMTLFGFLSVLLLLGVAIRAKFVFIQRMLLPGCLIGGVIGFIALHTLPVRIPPNSFETWAYHFFNISFISIGLTMNGGDDQAPYQSGELLRGAGWMALVQGMNFPMQAILSSLVVILLGFIGVELFPTFGFLAPLGFNEGPGQALSIGKAWEAVGFEHGGSIGLTFAAIGYAFGFLLGVPLVNYGVRQGMATIGKAIAPGSFWVGTVGRDEDKEIAGKLTTHSGNVDTLAFHAALVGLVYIVTWSLLGAVCVYLGPEVQAMIWGFFFFFGLLAALVVKWIMKSLKLDHLADPGTQKRITGWSIDYLTVSTICAIQMAVVQQFAVPILLITFTIGIATTCLIMFLAMGLDRFPLERGAAIYGTVTGTVTCGLLLVRIVDPDFRTPAAYEVGIMNLFSLPIIGVCMVLLNAPIWWEWSLGLTLIVFGGLFIASGALLRGLKLWRAR
jgi:ESS family glutamate:Na+ symporter